MRSLTKSAVPTTSNRLFKEIEDHLHSQARTVIKSRVGDLSYESDNHTHSIL